MSSATKTAAGARSQTVASVVFAGLAYLAVLAVSGYTVAFVAGSVVPRTVDSGGPHTDVVTAGLIDVLLLALFAVQHSAMARPAFKRRWTQLFPAHVERSCYLLLTTAVLALTFWQWRPIPAEVWHVHEPAARALLWTVFFLGWAIVAAMTFAIDHLEMAGVRQVRQHLRGRRQAPPAFRVPLPYRLVRHPMMTGFFLGLLVTPRMTLGHLLFGLSLCGYILFAFRLEEHDLTSTLPEYKAYAASTPRFLPRPR